MASTFGGLSSLTGNSVLLPAFPIPVFLIIFMMIAAVLIAVACVFFIVHFQHPDDKNTAWLPKIVVLIALWSAVYSVLLLPVDVANRNDMELNYGNTPYYPLPMLTIWIIMYLWLTVLAIVVIPFFVIYYESYEVKDTRGLVQEEEHEAVLGKALFKKMKKMMGGQLLTAAFITIPCAVIFFFFVFVLYIFLGVSDVPLYKLESGMVNGNEENVGCGGSGYCSRANGSYEIRVSLFVFNIALLCFLGTLLLIVFGGVGLIALPLDMILAWWNRPTAIDLAIFQRKKDEIHTKAGELLAQARDLQELQRHKKRLTIKQRLQIRSLKKQSYFMELDYEELKVSYEERGGNPLKYWVLLPLAIFGIALTVVWTIHLFLYVLCKPPLFPALNLVFWFMDIIVPMSGTVVYAIFIFYLLLATLRGVMKVGIRLLFFAVHPMAKGKTLMNSFLFNCLIIILTCVALVNFSVTAFGMYVRDTAIHLLFGVQIRNLRLLVFFYNWWILALYGVMCVSIVWFLFFPADRKKEIKEKLQQAKNSMAFRAGRVK